MATKKTAIFTITERLRIPDTLAGQDNFATVDIGSYVDVGDRQALQVHSVDYIFQGTNPGTTLISSFGTDSQVEVQLTDLNRGTLVFADDRALISSCVNLFDTTSNQMNNMADLFPDNFGKGSDDGRFVVNDTLYLCARASSIAVGQAVNVTVRINCSIVSLTAKDFMAIAIQSTAADN